jgi:hypothetical protein
MRRPSKKQQTTRGSALSCPSHSVYPIIGFLAVFGALMVYHVSIVIS